MPVLVILIIVMKCPQIHSLFLAVYYLLFLRLFHRQLFRSKINVCVPHSCNVCLNVLLEGVFNSVVEVLTVLMK